MSFAKATLSRKLLRCALNSASLPQHLVCHECLVRPSSCRIISSLAAIPSSSTTPAWNTRSQSTSTSTTSHSSTHYIPPARKDASHPETLQGRSTVEDDEPQNATSSSIPSTVATSKNQGVTIAARAMPTLEDLETLKPRKMPLPSVTDKLNSPDVAVYLRKFDSLAARVNRAFDKEQIIHLANLLGMRGIHKKMSKKEISLRFLTEHWGYIDRAGFEARAAARTKAGTTVDSAVEEDLALSDAQAFLLLGRMDGQELLRRIGRRNTASIYVRKVGDASRLVFTGFQSQIDAAKLEWKKVQEEIGTSDVKTGLSSALRPDLLTSLAMATDLHIATKADATPTIQITHHGSAETALAKLSPLLAQLNVQSAVCKAPKLAIVDQQNRSRFSSLPISPESLPWYMRGLPLAGYTRLTATYDNREHSSLVDADMKDASSEHLLKLLGKPLGTSQENISVTAHFGHFVRIPPISEAPSIGPSSLDAWVDSPNMEFLPTAPNGILNRYALPYRRYDAWQVENHTSNLDLVSQNFRRLRYVKVSPSALPLKMISVERATSGQNEQSPSPTGDKQTLAEWAGTHVSYSYVNMLIPHSSTDIRFEATSSTPISEEVLEQFSGITLKTAPPEIIHDGTSYKILEDQIIRQTRFRSGLQAPWDNLSNDYEAISEHIRDNMQRSARSRTFMLRNKNPTTDLSGLLKVMREFS